MVRAWYMDNSDADQRQDHMTDPPKFLSMEEVKQKTGISYYKVNADDVPNCAILNQLKKDHAYTYEDEVNLHEGMDNYEELIKKWYEEHLHSDEEIRLIIEGRGFFDARDSDDHWVRMEMVKGDMIVLPAGIYHRFTMDTKNSIHARRFFVGEPVWTPHNRPSEDHPARKDYLKAMTAQ